MRSITDNASRSVEGHPVSRSTRMPSSAEVTQARSPGISSTVTMQFAQSPVTQYRPRRRCDLSERLNVRTPARKAAEPIVSPSWISMRRPSKRSDATA
jgi:hypothetical protein